MIALQADMNDPESLAQRCRDRRLAHRLVHRTPPKTADGGHHAHHHVERMIRLELRPRLVALPGATPRRLSTSAASPATAPEQLLLHMPLPSRLRRHGDILIMRIPIVNLIEHI
ncbi:MAG TPA: hypothetical protein VIX73_37720 [Kofleriaceae bacterium]